MQNLPNDLTIEITKTLTLQDLKSLASISKEYNDLLNKIIKDIETIEKYIKETYYIRVTVRENRNIAYRFYIYNTKEALEFCRSRHNFNTKLFDSYISYITSYVVMVRYEHDPKLDKDIQVETKKINFQLFSDLVTTSYLEHIKSCDEEIKDIFNYYDKLFDMV